jgi:hypothetical protein
MELRANRPDGLPINKHVYLGEGKEGIRVGLRLSLLDEPTHHKTLEEYNKITTGDLMKAVKQDVLPGLLPKREYATLNIYGRSFTDDSEHFQFALRLRQVDGEMYGAIVKTLDDGSEEISKGRILQIEHGIPTDFKYFIPNADNIIRVEDQETGTFTDINIGKCLKLVAECGELSLNDNELSISDRGRSVELLDSNGIQLVTMDKENIAANFEARGLGNFGPTVASNVPVNHTSLTSGLTPAGNEVATSREGFTLPTGFGLAT